MVKLHGIEVCRAGSVAEVTLAIDVLDRIFAAHQEWLAGRDRSVETFRADPALMAIALDHDRVVGAVGSNGRGINVVGVDPAYRGQGIARRLLGEAEETLRQRGVRRVRLGSVDAAVDFYLKCGYLPQLLVQFRPEVEGPQRIVQQLLTGQLRDHEVFQTEFRGNPQLWVQVDAIDFAFKGRIEAVAPGTVAQYVMNKEL